MLCSYMVPSEEDVVNSLSHIHQKAKISGTKYKIHCTIYYKIVKENFSFYRPIHAVLCGHIN